VGFGIFHLLGEIRPAEAVDHAERDRIAAGGEHKRYCRDRS
jgi:hypothetical protein